MTQFVAMVICKGYIFENHRLPYQNLFREFDLDVVWDGFSKIPQNACFIICVGIVFLSSNIEQDLSMAACQLKFSTLKYNGLKKEFHPHL